MPQQMENHDKLHELSFTFYKISICNLLSHKSLPMKRNTLLLIFNMLVRVANVIVTNNHPRMCCYYFPLTCIFLQSIKFRNQKFFLFFQLHYKFYIDLGHLPLKTNNYFNLWKLNSLNILKNPIEFLFLLSFFFGKKNLNEINSATLPKDEAHGNPFEIWD